MKPKPQFYTPVEGEEEMYSQNERLIWRVIHQHFERVPIEKADMYQVGSIGLLKAIRTHDADKAELTTWATRQIFGEISKMVRDATAQRRSENMRLVYVDDPNTSARIPDEQCADMEDAADLADVVTRVYEHANERDRQIIYLRLEEGCTQQEIAERVGVSRTNVQRILRRLFREHLHP